MLTFVLRKNLSSLLILQLQIAVRGIWYQSARSPWGCKTVWVSRPCWGAQLTRLRTARPGRVIRRRREWAQWNTHMPLTEGVIWATDSLQHIHLVISSPRKVKVKVDQSCPTLCDLMDYTVHGILQARILEWVAFPFSKGSSQPRDRAQVSLIAGRLFTSWATREAQEYWHG